MGDSSFGFRVPALAAAVLLTLATAEASADTTSPLSATELTTQRLEAVGNRISPAELYTPSETVRGAADYTSLPRATGVLSSDSITEAAAIAEQSGRGVLMIWHDGAVVAERAFGGAHIDDAFDTFSMHKTLVGLLVGTAVERGEIDSVDDSLARYIGEAADDPRARIRLVDLLRMSGGIEDFPYLMEPADHYSPLMLMLWGNDVWGEALKHKVARAPGETFAYRDVETELLGIVLERATGERYADLLSQRIWNPIGAHDGRVWLDVAGGKPRVYCCFLTRAEDWVRVGKLLLDEGRVGEREIVPASWIRTSTAASPTNPAYGFQIWRGVAPEVGERDAFNSATKARPLANDLYYAAGFQGQRTWVIPSCRLVIVRMGVRQGDAWDEYALPNAVMRGLPDDVCPKPGLSRAG